MRVIRLAAAALICWCLTGCGSGAATSPSTLPSPDAIGIGVVNGTQLQVSLVVNGTLIETLPPGRADKAILMSALPPLPWVVEARTSSGRVLLEMTAGPDDVQSQPGISSQGKEAAVSLSCGSLYLWAGASEPSWPAPGSGPQGSPGDCIP